MRMIFLILFILLALAYDTYAFGVATDFLVNDTIVLQEGASTLYSIRVQNPSEQEAKFKVTYDDAFMDIIDYLEEYTIQPKSIHKVFFNISSANGKPGHVYTVSYTVHQLSGAGPGLPILIKIAKNFKLKIVKDTNKFYISELKQYIPQAVIILVIILVIAITKFRKKNKNGKIKIKMRKKEKVIK